MSRAAFAIACGYRHATKAGTIVPAFIARSSVRALQCVLAMASAEAAFVAVAPGSSFPAVVASKEKSCTSGLPPRFAESKNFFD
jgi:hypothetical protein